MKLGLLHPALKDIEATYGANVARCLMECLSLWLTGVARTGPPTWSRLATALNKIDETAAAENIRKTCKNNVLTCSV